ncbi:hypothetical protein GCK32_020491, partial [Trichostrongylus colubriformis]
VKTIYNDVKIAEKPIQLNMVGAFVALREDDCPVLYALAESEETLLSDNSTMDNSTIGIGFTETNSTETHDPYLPAHDHAILITK